jgi:hypothetical protein
MCVDVPDVLNTADASIEYCAKVSYACMACSGGDRRQHGRGQSRACSQFYERRHMLPRNHQDMDWGLRVDIDKRERLVVGRKNLRR